jgi:hypothetical protein
MQPLSEFDLPNLDFDPARFNDPLAQRIDWSPARSGGSSSRTRKLKQVGLQRIEFRPTFSSILSVIILLGIGLAAGGIPLYLMIHSRSFSAGLLIPILVGIVFGGIGCFMFNLFITPIVFDQRNQQFWKGWKAPVNAIRSETPNIFARFAEIHALQILRELCEHKDNSRSGSQRVQRYYSYELNLVLEDGSRITVTDHGDLRHLQTDAKSLAAFLGKPIWDATR